MGNRALSRQEIVEKYLKYFRNYFIPHKNEEKNEFQDTDFLVSILKISVITSSRTRRSVFYVQCLVDVVATVISNDAQYLVAFSENRRRKISKDH